MMAVELDSQAFKALSSPTRVSLLKKLAQKPRSLTALAQETGLSVQATDEHLRKLSGAGLVEKDKKTKWAYYRLTPAGQSLVAPNRQPVYLLLSASILLLLAAAFSWNTGQAYAAAPAATTLASQSAPQLSNAGNALTAAQPVASREAKTETPSPSPLPTTAPQPASTPGPWAYLFALAGLLCLAAAGYRAWRMRI